MASARVAAHPSRRGNQSVSSTTSAAGSSRGSERSSRTNGPTGNPAVESAVTRLLVSIKQLLEALTQWSKQEVTESHVSDVYVRLGNDFNAAVAAFSSFNIDMSELLSVPEDLRTILEQCLSEDATPENLEIYLPDVRKIITNLLQGLRGKQSMYRKIVSDHRPRSSENASDRDSRSSRSDRGSRSTSSRTLVDSSDTGSRRSVASSSDGRKNSPSVPPPPLPNVNGSDQFVGGFAPSMREQGDSLVSRSSTPVQRSRPQLVESNSYPTPRTRSVPQFEASSAQRRPSNGTLPSPYADQDATPSARPPMQAPDNVKRFSLFDRPVSSSTPPPTVIVDDAPSPEEEAAVSEAATSPPDSAPLDAPSVQNSLAALKKSDMLERRASKRFSTYNISKMTGGSIRERHAPGSNPNRRSLAAGSSLSPGELAALTEADEGVPPPLPASSPSKRERSRGPSTRSRNPSPIEEADELPPLPPLPPAKVLPPPPTTPPEEKPKEQPEVVVPAADQSESLSESSPTAFPVFLQVGREVKKVMMEPGLSFSSLRVLFVDKFSYSPGQDNFPAIYIRDPSSGVQYELEDMDEVKEKCLLSLNIEPLDQIKQHIDTQISSLSQDIKDLRGLVASSRRVSHPPPPILPQPVAESTPPPSRPTDRQFRTAARRLSHFMPDEAPATITEDIVPQMTGTSVMSDYSSRVVTDLKTQFDEVQNLRRDLGIMRQLYTEFMKQTKESLGALRTQTQTVRQLSTAKVGGARAYINDGKMKLDTRSQSVLTRMEELQDMVESIKDDVIKRNVSPKPQSFNAVRGDVEKISSELQSLKDHLQTIRPMWKKTWEEELQNIVEEQQFLQHQEELLSDLLEDHKALVEVLGHVEKVISLRGANSARGKRTRTFKPPPMEEGHTGLSTVMLEIRGAAVDPERRLKAIEANEKTRERELANRADEFQTELTGFVSAKKLKMTGGAEEAERIRQKRNDMTLKAMFSTPSPGSPSGSALNSPSLPPENGTT